MRYFTNPGRILSRKLSVLLPLVAVALISVFGTSAFGSVVRDATVSVDQSTAAISTTPFSTTSANELLLAFISTDYLSGPNTTVTGVSGGGLTWVLVRRTNVQSGSSEIWRAFATVPLSNVTVTATISQSLGCSLTVMSFAGVDTTGTNGSGAIGATGTANAKTGAPSASLTTTRNGSWVMGVGNDFDNAISRTAGPNQIVVHQDLTSAGDTYWVQMQSAPTTVSGTTVSISDTAPKTDRYNLSICEVLPLLSGSPTWSISGTISPSAAGAGATVTLTGASSSTVNADPSGNYSFTGLANGAYTVTPAQTGYTFNPTSQSVTINGANVASVNFTGTSSSQQSSPLGIDATVSTDGTSASATIASAPVTTTSNNELLLAFITTDYLSGTNTTVKSVSGGGLTWVLVQRTNVQSGGAEIWRAFAASPLSNAIITASLSQSIYSSISVMSFSGVNTTGTNGSGAIGAIGTGNANPGAPTASLTTTHSGSWVVGVGNDFDNAIARTPGTGQRLVHQFLTPTGDTYWVQIQDSPTPISGTSVSINDTAPTKDRYNLSICEILPGSGGGVNPTPPTVSMIAPATGGTVTTLSTLWALASDANGVASVQFLLDGASLGTAVTTQPYTITWNTATATSGAHTLAARAVNVSGLTTTSAPVAITVDNSGNPAVVGSWSSVVNIPAVAVDLILLQNNNVLLYQDGVTPTVWNYVSGTFTSVPTTADLFCSGHALFADGRVLIVGGYGGSSTQIGIANAEIFNPVNNSWTAVPNMDYKRWYPCATTLSDGTILVTAGWQTTNHTNAGIPEVYNASTNAWTELTAANNPFEDYPFIFQLSDGRVIHVGNSEVASVTDILDLTTQTWSVVDPNIVDGGSAAMYLPGKIMKAGSAADSQDVGASARTTYVLDTTIANPVWHQTPSMAYIRSFLNLPVLPDGTVLAIGGETDKNGGNIANAVYPAELWSPTSQTWTTMAPMQTPREYHGTALLLPDARVLVSGMGADFGNVPNEMNAQFYSPPYLFKGTRPVITQAPTQVSYGTNFVVTTPDAATITTAVLIRTGAVTHFFDQNTRYVPLTFQQTTGGLTLTAPASANFAPPGYYMLFLVNSAGIPSVAPFVQLQ